MYSWHHTALRVPAGTAFQTPIVRIPKLMIVILINVTCTKTVNNTIKNMKLLCIKWNLMLEMCKA